MFNGRDECRERSGKLLLCLRREQSQLLYRSVCESGILIVPGAGSKRVLFEQPGKRLSLIAINPLQAEGLAKCATYPIARGSS